MSSALIWELTRNNNSYLRKRNGYTFTTNPMSLTNRHLNFDNGNMGVSMSGKDNTFNFVATRRRRWGRQHPRSSGFLRVNSGNSARAENRLVRQLMRGGNKRRQQLAMLRVRRLARAQSRQSGQ